MAISDKKKRLLCEFVEFHCEDCMVGGNMTIYSLSELEIHRLTRGIDGGTYEHRNCKVVCKKHHGMYHANEWSHCKSKW